MSEEKEPKKQKKSKKKKMSTKSLPGKRVNGVLYLDRGVKTGVFDTSMNGYVTLVDPMYSNYISDVSTKRDYYEG